MSNYNNAFVDGVWSGSYLSSTEERSHAPHFTWREWNDHLDKQKGGWKSANSTEIQACLSCKEKVIEVENSQPPAWICSKCDTMHSIIKGEYCIVPTSGKINDWPELKEYMEKTARFICL